MWIISWNSDITIQPQGHWNISSGGICIPLDHLWEGHELTRDLSIYG